MYNEFETIWIVYLNYASIKSIILDMKLWKMKYLIFFICKHNLNKDHMHNEEAYLLLYFDEYLNPINHFKLYA